jgi:hypothetical protein
LLSDGAHENQSPILSVAAIIGAVALLYTQRPAASQTAAFDDSVFSFRMFRMDR